MVRIGGGKVFFRRIFYFLLILVVFNLLNIGIINPAYTLSSIDEDIDQFLPNLNYSWTLERGDAGSTYSSLSRIPCKPQVAYETTIPSAQTVLVEDGVIYSFDPSGRSGDAYALNETTGKAIWRTDIYSLFGRFITTSALGKHYYIGTTGIDENKPSLLIALDKKTGSIVWSINVDKDDINVITVYSNNVYLGTKTGLVLRIDEYGNILWNKTLEGKSITDLAYGSNSLYVNVEWSRNLYALNAENGDLLWVFEGNNYLSRVAYRNNMVFTQDYYGRKLITLSLSGSLLWEKEIAVNSFSIGEDAIYVVDYKKLTVLDFQGREIGEFNIPENERFANYYGVAVIAKNILALPVYSMDSVNYGRLYLLWKGINPVFNITHYGNGAISPKISIAYGKIYAVFYTNHGVSLYKLHDTEKPVIVSINGADEVYEGEEFSIRVTGYDDESGIYRALIAYSINGSEWKYVDMKLERNYTAEPVCGCGFREEPYIGKILAQKTGSVINWKIILIDNVGNYIVSQEQTTIVVEKRDVNPPVTTALYEDVWHNADFNIILIAEDDLSGVAETYYRINNGDTKRVSVDGYPLITTESANNTLEFWSIDRAGNEEVHKYITGIKLDKTKPIANAGGDLVVNVGETVVLDASLSIDNFGIESYEWNFGDGEKGSGVKVTHVYGKPGVYTITLTVKDYAGNTDTHKITIIVKEPFPTIIVVIAIIITIITVITVVIIKRRRSIST